MIYDWNWCSRVAVGFMLTVIDPFMYCDALCWISENTPIIITKIATILVSTWLIIFYSNKFAYIIFWFVLGNQIFWFLFQARRNEGPSGRQLRWHSRWDWRIWQVSKESHGISTSCPNLHGIRKLWLRILRLLANSISLCRPLDEYNRMLVKLYPLHIRWWLLFLYCRGRPSACPSVLL